MKSATPAAITTRAAPVYGDAPNRHPVSANSSPVASSTIG